MPDFGISPFDAAFVALQMFAAWSSLHIRRFSKLLLLTAAFALTGWGLLMGAELWFDSQASEYFEALPPPIGEQQTVDYNTDAASKGFVFVFGLPMALAATALSVAFGKLIHRMWLAFVRPPATH